MKKRGQTGIIIALIIVVIIVVGIVAYFVLQPEPATPPSSTTTFVSGENPFGLSHDFLILEELTELPFDYGYPDFPEGSTKNTWRDSIWAHVGLLKYDGTKKLAYYAYKLYAEKLTGSDWDNTQLVYNQNNFYAYKFIKNNNLIYVVWWDYWEEPSLSSKTIILSDLGITGTVKVTDAVPHFENGLELQNSGETYPELFNTGKTSISLTLGKSPVYIEENIVSSSNYVPHQWQDQEIVGSASLAKKPQFDENAPNICGDGRCSEKEFDKGDCLVDCN